MFGRWLFCVLTMIFATGFTRGDSASQAQWLQLKTLRGIASGAAASAATTYVFFDANCPFSAKLNKRGLNLPGVDLSAAIWIPVAYLRPSSNEKAAALLRAGKYESIIKNYQNFNYAKYEGSIEGVTPTAAESLALEQSRTVWMSMTSTPGTPMIVYKDASGEIKVQLGLPAGQSDHGSQTMDVYGE